MKLNWCCDVDQLDVPVADVVSPNILLQWFLGLLLCIASIYRLLRSPIFHLFFKSTFLIFGHIKNYQFLLVFISFLHLTKHKPIIYYQQIEWKKVATIFLITTRKTTDGCFGHSGFTSNCYLHFWGNSSSSFKQVYIMYK